MKAYFNLLASVFFIIFSNINSNAQNLPFKKDSIVNVLENVFMSDQDLRYKLDTLSAKYEYSSPQILEVWNLILANDSLNLSIVKKIIDKYGWLSAEESSKKSNEALFLVIQHADIKTQLNYLPILKSAVKNKKALPTQLALLVDRTNMAQGKFQVYGSQVKGGKIGELYFFPILDEPNVNKRRREIGLGTIEEYAKNFDIKYVLPDKDKYLGKIVIEAFIKNKAGQPLENVSVHLGNNNIIGKSDAYGKLLLAIDKKFKDWAFIFRKEGFSPFAICLTEKDGDVFTGTYILTERSSANF